MVGLIQALFTSFLLGLFHGIEPDHAAAIATLTSEKSSKESVLIGIFFALGHIVIVSGWLIVITFGMRWVPKEIMNTVGEMVLGIVLGLLGMFMVIQGVHNHRHKHREIKHEHSHLHLLGRGHGHKHGFLELFKFSLVGSAFALSPPLSMMTFLSAVIISQGLKFILVFSYALAILISMGLVGAGAGALFGYLQGRRFYAMVRALAGVLIIGYAVTTFL